MTKITHYVPSIKSYHYCSKGDAHSQQALNIVCLDKLCRQNPLGCAVCFSQIHKYHKTISLDDFLNDYQSNINKTSKSVKSRVKKQYQNLKQKIYMFNCQIQERLQNFQKQFEQYFCFLDKQQKIRASLSVQLGINLQPNKICQSNLVDLQKSLKFIISNSLFKQNRITNISSILKQNQNKTFALLDKMSNETNRCHRQILKCFQKLNFVKQTLNHQSVKFKEMIRQFNDKNLTILQEDPHSFSCKETFNQTVCLNQQKHLAKTNDYQKPHLNCCLNFQTVRKSTSRNIEQYPALNFGIYKNQNLIVDQKTQTIKSNISALTPQYALLTPTLNIQPQKQQNWSIKINNCRNFSSKNTLAFGLCSLQDLQRNNFQNPQSNQNALLVTSQGYVLKDGRCEKGKFIFGEGDTLHFKYDPFYEMLIISKNNGNKITLKAKAKTNLYACVRMTYASDEVQIV